MPVPHHSFWQVFPHMQPEAPLLALSASGAGGEGSCWITYCFQNRWSATQVIKSPAGWIPTNGSEWKGWGGKEQLGAWTTTGCKGPQKGHQRVRRVASASAPTCQAAGEAEGEGPQVHPAPALLPAPLQHEAHHHARRRERRGKRSARWPQHGMHG